MTQQQRVIKFRVWNPDKKVLTGGTSLNTLLLTTDQEFVKEFNAKGMIWMQFTGLLDKEGKEIYEGDVLGLVDDFFSGEIHTLGVVVWSPELCGFTVEAKLFKDDEGYTMTVYSTQENSADGNKQLKRKVLGNIYTNPELLNPKTT